MFRDVVLVFHIIGVVLGVGGASVADYVHLKGLKSMRMERRLQVIYPIVSNLIIIGVFVLVVTGSILVGLNPGLISSGLFKLKMVLVSVILINALVLHSYVRPHMIKNLQEGHPCKSLNKFVFETSLFGSISIVTWYGVLFLALLKGYGFSVLTFLGIYFGVLLLAFVISYNVQIRSNLFRHCRV